MYGGYLQILLVLGFIKYVHQVLYAVYLLQLKEYRHDRLREHLLRTHKHLPHIWFYTGIGAPLSLKKLPRPTAKAVATIIISVLVGLVLIWVFEVVGLIIMLAFSLISVLGSIMVVAPVEYFIRQHTYARARQKIRSFKNNGLVVIGITGSYGKTSTKNFLDTLLSGSFEVLSTSESINTPLGIARTILSELAPSHRFFIVEMGAYRIGEIKEMCDIVFPDVAIITGISNQHIGLFGSQENIIKAKSELLDAVEKGGVAFINKQSPHAPLVKNRGLHVIYYDEKSLNKDVQKKYLGLPIAPFLKAHLIPGVLCAQRFGISHEKIINALSLIKTEKKTMNIKRGIRGAMIINDSRNASEVGVMAALTYLSECDSAHKLVIMPCIIELGKESVRVHNRVGAQLLKNNTLAIITTRDYFDEIVKGAKGNKNNTIILMENPDDVKKYINAHVDKSWAILLEGKISAHIISYVS